MRQIFFLLYSLCVFTTLSSGLSLDNAMTTDTSLRPCTSLPTDNSSSDQKCPQSFVYNQKLDPIFGGSTSMNYFLTKNSTVEKASMVANYSRDRLNAKVIGSYKNNLATPITGSTSDIKLNIGYKAKLTDDLTTVASQTIFVSEQDKIPIMYTSSLEAKYFLDNNFHLYTQGTYSYLQEQENSLSNLTNPYSTTVGIGHTDDSKTSIKALYTLTKDQNPTLQPNKSVKLVAKHKITKKLNTTLSVKKSVDTPLQENNGILDLSYSF